MGFYIIPADFTTSTEPRGDQVSGSAVRHLQTEARVSGPLWPTRTARGGADVPYEASAVRGNRRASSHVHKTAGIGQPIKAQRSADE